VFNLEADKRSGMTKSFQLSSIGVMTDDLTIHEVQGSKQDESDFVSHSKLFLLL
jgi:hypothetical protein